MIGFLFEQGSNFLALLLAAFDAVYEPGDLNGLYVFLLLTVGLGGGAAWRTGEAVAESWGPLWPVVAYTALLAGAVRFLHYALFSGPLLSPGNFLVDFIFLLTVALVGHRARRVRHMTDQYPWLFERAHFLSWRARSVW